MTQPVPAHSSSAHPPVVLTKASAAYPGPILHRLRTATQLLIQTLREIFDESAYSRFLQRTSLHPNPASYAAFQAEHATAKARRPKCC